MMYWTTRNILLSFTKCVLLIYTFAIFMIENQYLKVVLNSYFLWKHIFSKVKYCRARLTFFNANGTADYQYNWKCQETYETKKNTTKPYVWEMWLFTSFFSLTYIFITFLRIKWFENFLQRKLNVDYMPFVLFIMDSSKYVN